jgi:hypothetical protein
MFLLSNPDFTISHWVEAQPFHDSAYRGLAREGVS